MSSFLGVKDILWRRVQPRYSKIYSLLKCTYSDLSREELDTFFLACHHVILWLNRGGTWQTVA